MSERLRVFIVDDSAVVRRALRTMLESDPIIQVVGEASNGQEALERIAKLRPNLITMDVRMPVMDGLETTEHLMAYHPTPILVVTASLSSYDIDITFQMLAAGALEVIEKPDLSDAYALERARHKLIRLVKTLARVRVVTHLRGRRRSVSKTGNARFVVQPAPESVHPKPNPVQPTKQVTQKVIQITRSIQSVRPQSPLFPLIIIGASTGGPRVIQQILMGLLPPFAAAVIVAQHIAEGFSAGMVEWLANTCPLPVSLAQEGDKLTTGKVLVVPDGQNLLVQPDSSVRLSDQPRLLRPAIDITMQTAAETLGSRVIGVLLTGMGRDGALGLQSIQRAGGYTIAQDETSCSIYGMPRAAVELGAVDEVLPPEGIIQVLCHRVGTIA